MESKAVVKKEGRRTCKDCKVEQDISEFSPFGTGNATCCKKCSSLVGIGNEKPVNQYDLDGKFIRRFVSAAEAEKMTGFRASNISRNCRGVIKTTKNYIWRYVEDIKKEKESAKTKADETPKEIEDEHEYDIEESDKEEESEKEESIKVKINSVIKTVAQYNLDGTFLKTHISGHEAARELEVTPASIYGAIRNNFVCKNYLWRYVENDEIIKKIDEVTPHRKYMKKVNVYKDGKLYKEFLSIQAAADGMKVNKSMVRKFLGGKKDDKLNLEWRFA
jgi:hypothetical protein